MTKIKKPCIDGITYLNTIKRKLYLIDSVLFERNYEDCIDDSIGGYCIGSWLSAVTIDQLPHHLSHLSEKVIRIGVHEESKIYEIKNEYLIYNCIPLEVLGIEELNDWKYKDYRKMAIEINPLSIKHIANPSIELVVLALQKDKSIKKYINPELAKSANELIELLKFNKDDNTVEIFWNDLD